VPIPPKTPSRVFRTAPAKAALAVGGAAVAACALLAFPATASAASGSANLLIRPSRPFPSFSFPGPPPSTQFPTSGGTTIVPVGVKKSSAPKHSDQPQFSYVSTFSPQPAASSAPANTASASCLANGQPVPGPRGDLDLPGINGTSQDAGHTGALPIDTLGPTAMLPPQIDSANLGQLKVTRPVDATSTNLSMVASSGYRFPCVHIEVGPGQGFANAEYALVNAGLVADDRSGSTETLTWTYSTILWSYTLPGSTTLHQGSGEINAQPDRTTTSLVTDSKAVAAGTIGLTLVVSLGLIALYIVGRRRHKARYRARYYRRAAIRAEREGMPAAPVFAMQATGPGEQVEPAQSAEAWEPQPGEAVDVVEAAEVAEAGEVAEASEAEAVEASEAVPASEAVAETVSEAVVEPEVVEESELTEEPELESAEAEPEAEPLAVAEPVEAESEPEATEPEAETEPGRDAEIEAEVEAQEPAAPEESAEPEEPAEAEASASAEKSDPESESESSQEPSESEAEPVPGDDHEPAAAR